MTFRAVAFVLLPLLGWACTAEAEPPACDARGVVPMTVPCEIASPGEPPHPHVITSGLLALGIPVVVTGGFAAGATFSTGNGFNLPRAGEVPPGEQPPAGYRVEPIE